MQFYELSLEMGLDSFTFDGNDVLELFKAITAHFEIETDDQQLETICRDADLKLGITEDVAQTSSSINHEAEAIGYRNQFNLKTIPIKTKEELQQLYCIEIKTLKKNHFF